MRFEFHRDISGCYTILHVASGEKFLVAEGNQKSGEGAKSGIGARRRDFWIIRDNPQGRISVKKATYGVRQKEREGEHEGNFTAAVQAGTAEKSAVSFTSPPRVKSSQTPG